MTDPKLSHLFQKINESSIDQIQEMLSKSELTSRELVLMYFDRIAKHDQSGENINAMAELNPDALHIAASLDEERLSKGIRGPLHGIPVVVKDNIDTGDKMHTTAGSLALQDHVAKNDAFLVKQLRQAGAIILGKANLTEWANFMTVGMPNGYSSRGGQVLNPYGPGQLDTGGSSAGSAAAVAANFVTGAIGTETSGSVLSPSSQHALVGIKPTVGTVSRSGIIPISHTQDTAGPIAKSVTDAVYIFQSIIGRDVNDEATGSAKQLSQIDLTRSLNINGLKGKRIGIARDHYFESISEEKQQIMDKAINQLRASGVEVVDHVEIPTTKHNWGLGVMIHEFKNGLNHYLKTVSNDLPVQSFDDIVQYNLKHKDEMLKYGQKWFDEASKTSGLLTEPDYLNELLEDQYLTKEEGIDFTLDQYKLDAIVTPNNVGAAIPAKAGYPSITVPAGFTNEGEPVGITFTGTAFSEPQLIEIAYSYEQASQERREPRLEP
ncbi:amidase [Alkalibacillus filiformis]|uniref:Amidase n=1 Tax=Alkalibacillus filiformis TaxID=200990 RepID=A0ABU0DU33_9BACI|nr:amidase family protein [Alkalibacillus filiformis]MDQ0351946.1 amidase [Alkalibacillus filiformis]